MLAGVDYNAGGCRERWRDFLLKRGGGLAGNPPGWVGAGWGAGIGCGPWRWDVCVPAGVWRMVAIGRFEGEEMAGEFGGMARKRLFEKFPDLNSWK